MFLKEYPISHKSQEIITITSFLDNVNIAFHICSYFTLDS